MNATTTASPAHPEIHLGDADPGQMPLELAADGVLRYVWQSAFGPILIEVREGRAFVNGQPVTPLAETAIGAEAKRPLMLVSGAG
jgi:hypothetical protein